MAVVIDDTVGGAAANSYVSLAEAADLALTSPQAAWWGDAPPERRPAMLVAAARLMQGIPWTGQRATDAQALAWPRRHVPIPDSPSRSEYPGDFIPDPIRTLQVDIALALLGPFGSEIAGGDPEAQVTLKKIDVLETRWAERDQGPTGWGRFPEIAQQIAAFSDASSHGVETLVRT